MTCDGRTAPGTHSPAKVEPRGGPSAQMRVSFAGVPHSGLRIKFAAQNRSPEATQRHPCYHIRSSVVAQIAFYARRHNRRSGGIGLGRRAVQKAAAAGRRARQLCGSHAPPKKHGRPIADIF
ncbi:unnamed protein product, partial [Iphiclides podalirius]